MYHRPLKFIPQMLQKLAFSSLLKSYPPYQPVYQNGKLGSGSDRNCLDRWQLIHKEIKNTNSKSVIDIGCAEGFYVLQSAKEGCVSLGIDADVRRLSMAYNQLISEKISGAGFLYLVIDENSIKNIPSADVVIFMSVLHHMMYSQGVEFSLNFLKELKQKVKKTMIFEMGQSNEIKNSWATQLPDMGSDPHTWIRDFVLSAGFSKVEKIGESDSYQKEERRAIFRVEP